MSSLSLNLLLTPSIPFPAPCSLWALDWCPLLHSVSAEMAKPSHSENGQAKLSVSLTALPAALAISGNDVGCNLLDPTFILILFYILYLTSVTWGCLKRPFLLRPLSSSLDFFLTSLRPIPWPGWSFQNLSGIWLLAILSPPVSS